jgi:hypothetical protein
MSNWVGFFSQIVSAASSTIAECVTLRLGSSMADETVPVEVKAAYVGPGCYLICLTLLLFILTACIPPAQRYPGPTRMLEPSETPLPTFTANSTITQTPVPTRTPTVTRTSTVTTTATATLTPIPTYVILRAEVIIAQAVCHYGPGQPYLYKYGVYQGNRLEVIRRVEGGNYVEIRAIGGTNPCWVKRDYLKPNGEWNNLQPVAADAVVLPISPYYGPPAWVKAERSGDEVTFTYSGISISPGKDSLQTPYIVEAWVCQDGQQVFVPAGSWFFSVKVHDEAGCKMPSHGRLLAAEKHGYTKPVEIQWPQPVE